MFPKLCHCFLHLMAIVNHRSQLSPVPLSLWEHRETPPAVHTSPRAALHTFFAPTLVSSHGAWDSWKNMQWWGHASPAPARQCIPPFRSPKRVRAVHLSACLTSCWAKVSKAWQVYISPQSIATAGGSPSQADEWWLLPAGVSLMEQRKTE